MHPELSCDGCRANKGQHQLEIHTFSPSSLRLFGCAADPTAHGEGESAPPSSYTMNKCGFSCIFVEKKKFSMVFLGSSDRYRCVCEREDTSMMQEVGENA